MSNIVIEGIGYVEAPYTLTSLEIEERFKNTMERFSLEPGLVEAMSGIKERRVWEDDKLVSDIAVLSAEKLLNKLDIDRDEIGCVVNPSVSRDYVEPTISIIAHDQLGLNNRCINFDINNACLGFTSAIDVVSNMLKLKQIKYGLIVCGENSNAVIKKTTDRLANKNTTLEDLMLQFATLTLGSGSVSMLLCREEDSKHGKYLIEENMFITDSKHNMLCYGDHNEMICDSQNMLKEGIAIVNDCWNVCKDEFSMWEDSIDYYVPHQVSKTHTKVLSKYINIPMERLELIYPTYGNTGPAAWPMGLVMLEKNKDVKKGNYVGVLSMGSGFNCSCMRLKKL